MKKTAKAKRTSLPGAATCTKGFLKDWERLSRSGRYNMRQLKDVMLLLIENDEPLGREWFDHPLLIYKIEEDKKHDLVIFVATGTHAELFE